MRTAPYTEKMRRPQRMVALTWVVSGLALFTSAKLGTPLGMLVCLPLVHTAWAYGLRWAVVVALLGLPFTITCMGLAGMSPQEVATYPEMALGHVLAGSVSVMMGYASDLRRKLEQETARRVESERAAVEAELQAKLQRSNRLATVGSLAAGVAHEVNNPLNYMFLSLELLSEQARASERAPQEAEWAAFREQMIESIDDAFDGAQRIQKIVADFKHYVRDRDLDERALVSLDEVIATAIRLSQPEFKAGTKLEQRIEPTPAVEGNGDKLTQVLVNLLVNAAQAIPAERGHGLLSVSLERLGEEAILRVRDDGEGIPEPIRPRIFDAFFTTKPVGVGTGLGLAVCRSIVRSHDGSLQLDHTGEAGTSFSLRLPLAQAAHVAPSAS